MRTVIDLYAFSFSERQAASRRARTLLERYDSSGPPPLFDALPDGKPYLVCGPHFSISYSGALAALAVCGSQPVGIDLERLRALPDIALRGRWLSDCERELISSRPAPERGWITQRFWSAKEACVKLTGAGVARMSDVRLSLSKDGSLSASSYILMELVLPSTHVGFLAVPEGESPELRWPDSSYRETGQVGPFEISCSGVGEE